MAHRPFHRDRVMTVLAAAAVLFGAGMPAASAHDELVATTPAPDVPVATPPDAVTLEFSGAVQALGAQVVVSGPDGAPVAGGAAEVREATVVQPLAADVPAGAYGVTWRVTSSDGHALSGEFGFTVDGAGAPVAQEPVTGGGDADVPGAVAGRPAQAAPAYGAVGVGAGLLAAGGLVLLLGRRRT